MLHPIIMSTLHISIDKKEVSHTLAFPYFTQRIPILAPSFVPIILTMSGLDNCWIISVTEDFNKLNLDNTDYCPW